MFKKTLLGAAIAAIAATSAAQADSFVDDSSLKITYKNYYWNENGSSEEAYDRDEWVHAVVADYKSGYFADIIGFDLSLAYADLIQGDEHASITNVPKDSSGKADDLNRVPVAYLKAKYDFSEDVAVKGGFGSKKRNRLTFGDSGSRITHASSYGTDLDFSVYGVDLYATQVTRYSERNASAYAEKLTNGRGTQIDNLNIFGAAYTFENGLALAGEYANSKDYMKKTHLQADYTIALEGDMSLDLNARYGTVEEDGKLYGLGFDSLGNPTDSDPDNDYESKYYNLNATLNFGNAYVGLGYNKTKDGDYDNALFSQHNGTYNSSLDMWEGYNLQDTDAVLLSAGYDFADMVPGLSADVWYAQGSGAKDIKNYSQREIGTYVNYAFSGTLDGLNVAYLYTNYRASGTDSDGSIPGQLYDEDVNRIYITYTYEVF